MKKTIFTGAGVAKVSTKGRSSINLNAYLPFVDTFIIYSFPIKFVIKKTNLHCKIIIFLYSYYVNRN